MGISNWLRQSYKRTRHAGLLGARDSIFWLYMSILKHISTIFESPGENVYDQEWDLLILLDSCRVDAIHEVSDEYDFLDESHCGTITSVDSTSEKWHTKTFTEEYSDKMEETILVTGNYKSKVVDENNFKELIEVWRDDWDLVPARPVTDAAIEAGRTFEERDRMIVHYMQPHLPSFPSPPAQPRIKYNGGKEENWHRLRRGELSESEVWKGYIENLRYVLNDVELLLDNIDADTVAISADHGDAKGEFGVYSHPHGIRIPCLIEVPWCLTTAKDTKSYIPGDYSTEEVLLEPNWPDNS